MHLKHLVPQGLRDYIAWILSRRELHRSMKSNDLGEIVRSTFSYRGTGVYREIYPLQKVSEILALAQIVREARPRITVEIGTAKGGTLFIWTRSNPQLELLVSIDLPGGSFGGGYDTRRTRLYTEFARDRPQTEMVLLRSDSHSEATLAGLQRHLQGRKVDFLWIDGDHTYEGSRKDFLTYSALVRKGGIVAFHDVVTKGGGHEVYRLWDELKTRYPSQEIVEDRSSNMGIGLLTM